MISPFSSTLEKYKHHSSINTYKKAPVPLLGGINPWNPFRALHKGRGREDHVQLRSSHLWEVDELSSIYILDCFFM